MALRAEVVDLIRLHLLHNMDEARRIRQIAVMKDEVAMMDMRVFIQVIDAIGVE